MTPPRSFNEIEADAVEGVPFSNGSEGDSWMAAWCETCRNDATEDCPIIGVAFMGMIPAEWKPGQPASLTGRWRCTEYARRTT